ncbi:tryptophan--tRNA ligase, chloroplastic/mitochondrial-like [Asparagus officinalis]|uniref:tryptophan--tRNA ligase, chloroplastic/mitochondrial-like n=1 Tax=Asparagus officinalis TaxID=4686 RepID=UPI00098E3EA0|nr:tryptophan--tRNA ligase, chloroplastic/mitochondrial-like [Asparagus officinalis]
MPPVQLLSPSLDFAIDYSFSSFLLTTVAEVGTQGVEPREPGSSVDTDVSVASRRRQLCPRLCSVAAPSTESTQSIASPRKKRVVSGVQPTGSVHLGNYLGAIKNWVSLQDTYETLFFIVDFHAITLPYEAVELSKATRNTAAIYLACGVDVSKVQL